jgi:hypothetical protein
MVSELTSKRGLNAYSDQLRAEAHGVLVLLNSARISLEAHAVEDSCVATLMTCITRLQDQYDVSDGEVGAGIVWRQASVNAILRLLDYVKGEILDKLNDEQCVDEISMCIDYLLMTNPTPQYMM